MLCVSNLAIINFISLCPQGFPSSPIEKNIFFFLAKLSKSIPIPDKTQYLFTFCFITLLAVKCIYLDNHKAISRAYFPALWFCLWLRELPYLKIPDFSLWKFRTSPDLVYPNINIRYYSLFNITDFSQLKPKIKVQFFHIYRLANVSNGNIPDRSFAVSGINLYF